MWAGDQMAAGGALPTVGRRRSTTYDGELLLSFEESCSKAAATNSNAAATNIKAAAMNSKAAATLQQPDRLPSELHLVGVAASCRLPSEQLPGLRQEVAATHWQTLPEAARQVRKTPSWPRSFANFSLLQPFPHSNAWGNPHILGQPDTFLARQTLNRTKSLDEGGRPQPEWGKRQGATDGRSMGFT
jgi:hypothetical protein